MAANGLIKDLYQLTMANALFKKGMHERRVVFDRFYRKNPFNGGYTVVAGLAHLPFQTVLRFRLPFTEPLLLALAAAGALARADRPAARGGT